MAFYIYNLHGQIPYESGKDWRRVSAGEEVAPAKKGKQDFLEVREKKKEKSLQKEIPFQRNFSHSGREAPLYASQIMTSSVKALKPFNTLEDAWNLIDENIFRHVPILSEEEKLVGIVSDRGLIHMVASLGENFAAGKKKVFVSDIMVRNVLTARPHTDISYISQIFVSERIGAMPIMGENDKLLGILTRTDILRTLVKVMTPNHFLA